MYGCLSKRVAGPPQDDATRTAAHHGAVGQRHPPQPIGHRTH
jgi:hypothetical protein